MDDRFPLIVDVKRGSTEDGPGIRTTIFFKGCPLSCVWCQNPETLSARPELQRWPERCTGCRACEAACPENVARAADRPQPRGSCRHCGACADACEKRAIQFDFSRASNVV